MDSEILQAADLPGELRTSKFIEAIDDFMAHRRESKHPMTPTALKRLIATCKGWGHDVAVEAIIHATVCGWRGVFLTRELKHKLAHKHIDGTTTKTAGHWSKQCTAKSAP